MVEQKLKRVRLVKIGNSTGFFVPIAYSRHGSLQIGKEYNIDVEEADNDN